MSSAVPSAESTTTNRAEPAAPPRHAPLLALVGRVEPVLVALCVAVGAVLRFTPSTPMWLDEALTVDIASAPLADIGGLLRHDGHPPLYYYVLHVWMEVFGTGAGAVRALSGLIGVGVLAMVFVVARRHGGPRLARAAVALVAVSPFAIRYSSEARMYELVTLLVLVGWWLVDRVLGALDEGRPADRRILAALWLVSGALLLTHYWAIFLLAAVGLLTVAAAWRARGGRRRGLVELTVALALGGLWFVPWLPAFAYQSAHTGTPWAPASRPTRLVSESLVDWSGGIDPEALLGMCLLAVLLVLGALGERREGRLVLGTIARGWRRRAVAVVGLTLVVGAVASVASHAAFAGRYSSVVYPLAMLLAAAGVAAVPHAPTRVAVLALAAVLGASSTALALTRDRTQAGQVAAVLRAEARPGDLVVVCPDQLGPALSRLAPAGVRVVRTPDLGDPRFVDWVDYKERLEAVSVPALADRLLAEAGDATLWLVWSGGYRIAGPQCDELAARLAAIRPGSAPAVAADPVKYFESASLIRLAAR